MSYPPPNHIQSHDELRRWIAFQNEHTPDLATLMRFSEPHYIKITFAAPRTQTSEMAAVNGSKKDQFKKKNEISIRKPKEVKSFK